ncbi:F-box protein [Abeliophyllum distichum]|uniref:F-box protein n=1 Tax=Abeliophyllum distichum TaxID=126358 RepID=A0ABD1V6Y9_9LAMI
MHSLPDSSRSHYSSIQNIRKFDGIKNLQTELPSRDLTLENGTMIKWVARFGKALKSCVILGFRNSCTCLEGMVDFNNNGGIGGSLIMGFTPTNYNQAPNLIAITITLLYIDEINSDMKISS